MDYQQLDDQAYNNFTQSHPNTRIPIEQSPLWCQFQADIPGRSCIGTFLVRKNEQPFALFSLLGMNMNGYSYSWCNQGPVWIAGEPTADEVESVAVMIKEITAKAEYSKHKPLFARAHFPETPKGAGIAHSNSLLEKTTIVDLTKPFDDLLLAMDPDARYGMRKSIKAGITMQEVPHDEAAAHFDRYYQILAETAERNGFHIHPKSTYETMLDKLEGHARLFAAFENDTPITWAIVTVYQNYGIYYYGAGNERARKLMAAYFMQIEIMRQLQSEGITHYDFLGIGSKHYPSLQGVTRFKLRFGGEVVDYTPTYDLPLQPLAYKAWKTAQTVRRKLKK